MISDARGGHVSPGVYTEEKDVTYSVKSLGITSLGIAGETIKGPAFQPIEIKDWSEFVDYFGGTSPEKYIGTDIPKYELPYIAKEYLKESKNLHVCRVLGLSGYDAKKAWVIQANSMPVVILRSKQYEGDTDGDVCIKGKGTIWKEYVTDVQLSDYTGTTYNSNCQEITPGTGSTDNTYNRKMYYNPETDELKGKFAIKVTWSDGNGTNNESVYNVSLNEHDNDYIYNVLGIDPIKGSDKIYIEAVFDQSAKNALRKTVTTATTGEVGGQDITCTGSTNESDYSDTFRPAITPWFVSEVKGTNTASINVKKLFRFYTISDGNVANRQVKVSIQRILPEEGTFDVVIRDFYDTDANPIVLERFSNCTMSEGDSSYIGLKVGTADGLYESRSKYVVVEVANGDELRDSVPAGFLGYPVPMYGCSSKIDMNYNIKYNSLIKPKRQYFGMTPTTVDEDVISYKGKDIYNMVLDGIDITMPSQAAITNGFHLDSIFSASPSSKVYVDGISGYTFECVSPLNESSSYDMIPRILTEDYMENTIYADINLRKFTCYFYGGFDGWNAHEKTRSNTNRYRADQYAVVTGENKTIYQKLGDEVGDVADLNQQLDLNLPATAITSDYYAYLAAYRQFANPNDVMINVFATPGIDWYNNQQLVEEALNVVEDLEDGRNGDCIYIVTTPMYDMTPKNELFFEEFTDMAELSGKLDDTDIDTSYAATYYPWAKYYDSTDHVYITMPVTRDVVRNIAYTDNKLYPWFSPAGVSRGTIDCVKSARKLTLSDEDDLYNGRINPIKSFSKDGVKVWGNKTMYTADTPLNRVNVRRLMIRVKQLVIDASKDLIFEQYDVELEKQFRSLVNPILSDVKDNRGIVDYKIITECTPETRDQHILPAKILVKPTPALEYISITFTVYPESVEFEE